MKKFLIAAALLCAGTFAPQTELFGSSVQNVQLNLKGGPDVGVMEGWVFCSVPTGVIEHIEVFNASRVLVASSSPFTEEASVDISSFPNGVYYVRLTTSKWGTVTVPVLNLNK